MSGKRRIKLGVGGAAVALAIGLSACGGTPSVSGAPAPVSTASTCGGPPSAPAGTATALLSRTNNDRAVNGLPALRWDAQLDCLAQPWSAHMAATGSFVHQNLAGIIGTYPYNRYRTLGENILRGPGSMTANQMEDAWLASPGHRANILSRNYTSVAFGIAFAADGRVYVTADFGG